MRVTIPELISITSDNLYLNDVLDEYGFNKVFHPSLMNDMVTLLKNKLKLGNSVVIDDRLDDLGYKHIYVKFNENDNYSNMNYKFIIEDNVADESNNGLIPSTDYFSSLLSIKDMNNDELGSHGYIIRFKEQENTESDSSGLSGPVVPPITAPISAPPLSPAPEDGEDADSVDF